MADEPSVYDLIRDEVSQHPERSDEASAIAVLNRLKVAHRQSVALQPLVEDAVAGLRRDHVRVVERAAFSEPKRQLVPGAEPVDTLAARKQLLDESFAVNGRRVMWGDATVEDHRERIEMLGRLVSGLSRTIAQHEEAIASIEAAGATCLRDIEEAA